jgi:hypothetical protein
LSLGTTQTLRWERIACLTYAVLLLLSVRDGGRSRDPLRQPESHANAL